MHKVVIVGAGSAIARALIDRLSGQTFQSVVQTVAFTSRELDVTQQSALHKISIARPAFLYFFAGVITPAPFAGGSLSAWHQQINVNLLGAYNVAQAALAANPKCRMIFVGSNAARKPRQGWSAYCTSKAALNMMVECMIAEGIDAWVLNIGRTDTRMRRALFPGEDPDTLMTPDLVAKELLAIMLNRRTERIAWFSRGPGV